MNYLDFITDPTTLADAVGDGVAYSIENDPQMFDQIVEALTAHDDAMVGKLVREHIRAIIEDEWCLISRSKDSYDSYN
jgi:DNA-binding GntR family transcriptional regulator